MIDVHEVRGQVDRVPVSTDGVGAATAVPARRAQRVLWLLLGLVSVGVGGLGVVVPGLPTTVFFIAATACFARSSPRMEAWVLGLPGVGAMVRDHRDGLGMPRRAKVVAVSMMTAAAGSSVVLALTSPVARLVVAGAAITGVGVVIWWVPTREAVVARRQSDGVDVVTSDDLPVGPPTGS